VTSNESEDNDINNVRQYHHRTAGRSESPPEAPGKTETLPEDSHDDEEVEPESLSTVVVETVESNEVELPEQNVEVEAGETVEASPDSGEQYDDEGFEKGADKGDDETGSVTSTDNR